MEQPRAQQLFVPVLAGALSFSSVVGLVLQARAALLLAALLVAVVGGVYVAFRSRAKAPAEQEPQEDPNDPLVKQLAPVNQRLQQLEGAKKGTFNLKTEKFLGMGSFGVVYLARTEAGESVVQKEIALRGTSPVEMLALVAEVTNHALLSHPHIVRLFGAHARTKADQEKALYMVLDYADGGSLQGRIARLRDGSGPARFAPPVVTAWLAQLTSAVMHMHQKKILHRDLSSDNIFHRANGDVLVGDLGLSKKVGSEKNASARLASLQSAKAHTMLGTPQYMSPELLNGEAYGRPTDVWAVGILLFEMLALECAPPLPLPARCSRPTPSAAPPASQPLPPSPAWPASQPITPILVPRAPRAPRRAPRRAPLAPHRRGCAGGPSRART